MGVASPGRRNTIDPSWSPWLACPEAADHGNGGFAGDLEPLRDPSPHTTMVRPLLEPDQTPESMLHHHEQPGTVRLAR